MDIDILEFEDNLDTVTLRTEYQDIRATVVARDQGWIIANYDGAERGVAIVITQRRDKSRDYCESKEGETFGVTHQDQYVVRRTDNAGSLAWTENTGE